MGKRPTNSGMRPYVMRSVCSTWRSTSFSALRAPDACRSLQHTPCQSYHTWCEPSNKHVFIWTFSVLRSLTAHVNNSADPKCQLLATKDESASVIKLKDSSDLLLLRPDAAGDWSRAYQNLQLSEKTSTGTVRSFSVLAALCGTGTCIM